MRLIEITGYTSVDSRVATIDMKWIVFFVHHLQLPGQEANTVAGRNRDDVAAQANVKNNIGQLHRAQFGQWRRSVEKATSANKQSKYTILPDSPAHSKREVFEGKGQN